LIRDETAITVGCIIKRIAEFLESQVVMADNAVDPRVFKVEDFMKTLIRNGDGSMNSRQIHEDPYSNAHFLTDDEWFSIQSTTLLALSHAFSNASSRMISVGSEVPPSVYQPNNSQSTPVHNQLKPPKKHRQRALHAAENLIRHSNVEVRESAACVLGTALDWLQKEHVGEVLNRLLLNDFRL
jgi:hypothetical protein